MSKMQDDGSSTASESKVVYDLESQAPFSASLQRTLAAIGDKTAFIIKDGKETTTLRCEPLRVEYELAFTKSRWRTKILTRFTRRNTKDAEDVLVAEWELNTFGTDRLRYTLSPSLKDFFPTKSYLRRDGWFKHYMTFNQRFEANGRGYIWRSQLLSGGGSMKLLAEGNDEPIAKTHCVRNIIKPRLAFIEMTRDEGILNELVVTWAIVKQRSLERAAIYNLVHTLLIDCLLFVMLEIFVWRHDRD